MDKIIKEDKKLSRNIKLYLNQRNTAERLDDIGTCFGIGGPGVCQAGRRISGQLEKDKSLAKTIKKIEDNLSRMKV